MSSILTVKDLAKTFPPAKKGEKPFQAVKGISFELGKGEILGLLGPNGAGKSTTIAMLLGIMKPSSGSIDYFGKDFSTHRSQIVEEVTFASTYIKLPWRLTVYENLIIYGRMYGLSGKVLKERIEHFLNKFDVWNQHKKTMNQLSAGQMTRVMLAKAFIPHPKVALLDEPTASLDPDIAHQVRAFVLEQQAEYGTSILYTSHNMDEVTEVCDRVMFLRQGQIIAIDTPEKLASSVSTSHMRLQITDGLKRTQKFAQKQGLSARIDGREIEIDIDEHQIASFLQQLAEEDISYSQISIAKPSLEDYFLSMSRS